MKLYREHYQPRLVRLESAGDLNAVATASENRRTLVLKVVNAAPHETACAVEVAPSFPVASAKQWVVTAGLQDRNTLDEPARIAPVEGQLACGPGGIVHRFPAHSVTVMEFRR